MCIHVASMVKAFLFAVFEMGNRDWWNHGGFTTLLFISRWCERTNEAVSLGLRGKASRNINGRCIDHKEVKGRTDSCILIHHQRFFAQNSPACIGNGAIKIPEFSQIFLKVLFIDEITRHFQLGEILPLFWNIKGTFLCKGSVAKPLEIAKRLGCLSVALYM